MYCHNYRNIIALIVLIVLSLIAVEIVVDCVEGRDNADTSTTILNGSSSKEDTENKSSKMSSNPFKRLHQSLLAKEKNRKDGFKRLSKRLQFWKRDEKKENKLEETSIVDDESTSMTNERHVLSRI